MKHPSELELIAYRDGDMKERKPVEEHLQECGECRAELQRIEDVLIAMKSVSVPDSGEDYGRRVWQAIAPQLPEKRVGRLRVWFEPRRLAAAASIAALAIAAFVAGILMRPKTPAPLPGNDEAQIREKVLWLAVGEHLGRTEMMLMDLANTEPKVLAAKRVDISPEQRRAEDLLEENRLYRETALQEKNPALVNLLDSLDRVLLDVAHSPGEITPAELETIQHRISGQELLLKIRVVQQQLREKRNAAEKSPAEKKSNALERNKA